MSDDTRRAVAKSHAGNYNIDFRTRCVTAVRDTSGRVKFQVICYGMSHEQLIGGAELGPRLERRGLPMGELTLSNADPAPMRAHWNESGGRLPGPTGHLKPIHWDEYK